MYPESWTHRFMSWNLTNGCYPVLNRWHPFCFGLYSLMAIIINSFFNCFWELCKWLIIFFTPIMNLIILSCKGCFYDAIIVTIFLTCIGWFYVSIYWGCWDCHPWFEWKNNPFKPGNFAYTLSSLWRFDEDLDIKINRKILFLLVLY